MKFTPSADGEFRATVGIYFRVGVWELCCGVLRHIESDVQVREFEESGELADRPEVGTYIDGLTKAEVQRRLRAGLEERGYLLFESSDLDEDTTAAVEAKVRELFPEVV